MPYFRRHHSTELDGSPHVLLHRWGWLVQVHSRLLWPASKRHDDCGGWGKAGWLMQLGPLVIGKGW